jgi:glycosyltransferase involved in cell wall biosynthesis
MRYPECSSPELLRYLMESVPRSVGRADLILADSQSTKDDLVTLLDVDQERIHVLYPAVEARFGERGRLAYERDHLQSRYGISGPFILGLGTLQPRKNFEGLIRAYAALKRERRVPHRLVIGGGRGWLFQTIEATIDELDLEDDVLLIGFVEEADLPALYRQADLFAFPSLYEGFGIPILEAMACGTPVVTSDVSSLPEVAGDAGLLVSPQDVEALAQALWHLLDDSTLVCELVAKGFEQVRQFSWRRSAQRLLGIYDMVLQNGGRQHV